jgi:hypothetical protein
MMAAAAVNPFNLEAFEPKSEYNEQHQKENLMTRLSESNDKQVSILLGQMQGGIESVRNFRSLGGSFSVFSASYCHPPSKYYKNPEVLKTLEYITEALKSVQNPDGTLDFGNLQSPPDTGFLIETITAGVFLLMQDNSDILKKLKSDLEVFINRAAVAIAAGGVHTPNHRWVVCAALSRANAIYPNKVYVDRIHDWLGEGVYMDEDGEYPERSKNYDRVENGAFIDVGRLLDMPELYDYVRISLRKTYYHMEPNGDLITNNSRRQDQFSTQRIVGSYLFYRYFAIHDNDSEFAAVTRFIEGLDGFEESILSRSLVSFMENPLLQEALPEPSVLPVYYEKVFPGSSLLRIRRGDTSTTFFGGTDWPFIIASGRSHIPDFYSYRKGEAILRHMRLSCRFFSMGYFRSNGLRRQGESYVLHNKWEVPYYHPLPPTLRNKNGDYRLTPSIDDRFWSKMDFGNRPVTLKTLEMTVSLTEENGRNNIMFNIDGSDGVPVTIELCFREGGQVSGVRKSDDGDNNYFLEGGTGQYRAGGDVINFGPGTFAHSNIRGLEGEKYSTHSGSLRTAGVYVYITGITPFVHELTFN